MLQVYSSKNNNFVLYGHWPTFNFLVSDSCSDRFQWCPLSRPRLYCCRFLSSSNMNVIPEKQFILHLFYLSSQVAVNGYFLLYGHWQQRCTVCIECGTLHKTLPTMFPDMAFCTISWHWQGYPYLLPRYQLSRSVGVSPGNLHTKGIR